jgi:hypothetical protein
VDIVELVTPLATMAFHLGIFVVVTALGKASLNLVAAPNACPHLVFPFQFFDFVYIYSFFALRNMDQPLELAWILQQALLQFHIILRNAGIIDAFMKRYLARTLAFMLCISRKDVLKTNDPARDPLLRLQYLARLSWQFDLADIAALIATPTVVSLFVWRDGFYSVQDSGILVRSCNVQYVWLRFGVLLIVKPGASTIARWILARTMRKTMLGKSTIHGTSRLAAKIIAERNMVKHKVDVDEKVQSAFDYVEEELAAVKSELSLSGLDFQILRTKQMRKWRFYLAVIVLQLFSAFRVKSTEAYYTVDANDVVVSIYQAPLPLPNAWNYVPPSVALELDEELVISLTESLEEGCVASSYTGWPHPNVSFAWTSVYNSLVDASIVS